MPTLGINIFHFLNIEKRRANYFLLAHKENWTDRCLCDTFKGRIPSIYLSLNVVFSVTNTINNIIHSRSMFFSPPTPHRRSCSRLTCLWCFPSGRVRKCSSWCFNGLLSIYSLTIQFLTSTKIYEFMSLLILGVWNSNNIIVRFITNQATFH